MTETTGMTETRVSEAREISRAHLHAGPAHSWRNCLPLVQVSVHRQVFSLWKTWQWQLPPLFYSLRLLTYRDLLTRLANPSPVLCIINLLGPRLVH